MGNGQHAKTTGKCRAAGWLSATTALTLLPNPALAQERTLTFFEDVLVNGFGGSNVMLFALFMGAFSFSMMAATWLIRDRRRLERDHKALALEHSDLRARHERAQALLDVPDQRVVIWNGWEERPLCRGTLPSNTGAPESRDEFVAFGSWMTLSTAHPFEQAVSRLREKAEGFDLTVETQSGTMIEVQGRASGSHAFVRFISISGDRAALANLEHEHTQLQQQTDTMRALLETVPTPVWLRDRHDRITWANSAYLKAG